MIKNSRPFSIERNMIMKNGYETIHQIQITRSIKEGKVKYSFGATDAYGNLIKKIIKKVLQKKEKCLFFEAGVGTGKIINSIAGLQNVTAMGCDVYINEELKKSDLMIYECTIYEALRKLNDKSIDVFYWNDVIEHIPEDEIEDYLKLLQNKMNVGGIIITITPNRIKGPCDVTSHFEPRGTIAKGFHFHEYTFYEIIKMFQKYNFESVYGFLGYAGKGLYILGFTKIIDKIKFLTEVISIIFPYFLKKILITITGCDVSIIKNIKKNDT